MIILLFNMGEKELHPFELQKLANELGLIIHVCHFPPGTSFEAKVF
jgi:hypothetical protein